MMISRPSCRRNVRSLFVVALLFGIGDRDGAAQILSLEGGYRGRSSGPSHRFRPPGGPFIGVRLAPLNSGWASLGAEGFWVPSVSDVLIDDWCVSNLTTGACVKRVD